MIDWLVKRLTPYRAGVERWAGFASATQAAWEAHFDPVLSRIERMRSYYQADKRDLQRLIREMGDYFAEELPNDADLPIAVSWRRLELEYKDLELIVTSVFRRNYGNLPVHWLPVFAPVDATYGSEFHVAPGPRPELKNVPPEGMFLTSRGRLGVDYGVLLARGLQKDIFLERAVPLLRRTKPLHIVYDGPLFYLDFDLPVHLHMCGRRFRHEKEWHEIELPFSTIGGRYDFTSGDVRPVDNTSLDFVGKTEVCWSLPFIAPDAELWHLDWHLPDSLVLPALDMIIPGHEGQRIRPFSLLFSLTEDHFSLPAAASVECRKTRRDIHGFELPFSTIGGRYDLTSGDIRPVDNTSLDFVGKTEVCWSLPFIAPDAELWRLDWRLPDSLMLPALDMIIPGHEGQRIRPFSLLFSLTEDHFSLPAAASVECRKTEHNVHGFELPFSTIGGRYDFTSGDIRPVDNTSLDFVGETTDTFHLTFNGPERRSLDVGPLFDDIPADYMPLDTHLGGCAHA